MPLTDIQRMVIEVLRPFRSRDHYVGGGAVLNDKWPRLSDDMDIFRDIRDQIPNRITPELQALGDAGFTIEEVVNTDSTVEVIVRKYGFETKIQWMDDSEISRRFFPAIDDENFGFRLHQADTAVNKVFCACRRVNAARDVVDLMSISQRYCQLGPLVWATVAKDLSLTPTMVISQIRKTAFGYSDEEIQTVQMANNYTVTRNELRMVLDQALDLASNYCDNTAPDGTIGHLFVDTDQVPIEADEQMIANGTVEKRALQDFSVIPKIKE